MPERSTPLHSSSMHALPPRLGYACRREAGFEIVEMNASDTRNKSDAKVCRDLCPPCLPGCLGWASAVARSNELRTVFQSSMFYV